MHDPRISPHDSTCAGGAVTERPGKRGDVQIACPGCGRWAFLNADGLVIPKPSKRTVVAIPTPDEGPTAAGSRPERSASVVRFTLECITCDATIECTDRRPRVPLCGRCIRNRDRAERGRKRQAALVREARRTTTSATQ